MRLVAFKAHYDAFFIFPLLKKGGRFSCRSYQGEEDIGKMMPGEKEVGGMNVEIRSIRKKPI